MAEIKRGQSIEAYARLAHDDFEQLLDIMPEAAELEWTAAPRRRATAVGVRASRGAPGDPTTELALDERRLELREAIERARIAMRAHSIVMRAARRRLADALRAYGLAGGAGDDDAS